MAQLPRVLQQWVDEDLSPSEKTHIDALICSAFVRDTISILFHNSMYFDGIATGCRLATISSTTIDQVAVILNHVYKFESKEPDGSIDRLVESINTLRGGYQELIKKVIEKLPFTLQCRIRRYES